MWMDYEEMLGNPNYGEHTANCLMNSYCPKNPFKRKNLLSTDSCLDSDMMLSMMDPRLVQQQKPSHAGTLKYK